MGQEEKVRMAPPQWPWRKLLAGTHLGDQVRVADDGPHKEAVVRHLGAHLHTGCTQIQVHFVVGARDSSQGKVAHAVELQLEGERWLQVAVDPVLLELHRSIFKSSIVVKSITRVLAHMLKSAWTHSILWHTTPTLSLARKVKNLGNSLCDKKWRGKIRNISNRQTGHGRKTGSVRNLNLVTAERRWHEASFFYNTVIKL